MVGLLLEPRNDQTVPIMAGLQDLPVVPETHRAEAYIEIAEADPEQAHPGAKHMAAVQTAYAGVTLGANRCLRDLIEKPADQMAKRVTAKRVACEQENVDC